MSVHIFGIRHHGPGSARSLIKALKQLKPEAILVEGPPDAEPLLPLLVNPQMKPPVAILIYAESEPQHAVYYPFAVFSPEWQTLRYALTNDIPVRFMDLPQAHRLAISRENTDAPIPDVDDETANFRQDPLKWVAEAAGYNDSERWWSEMVEQRRQDLDLFIGIQELMTALREESTEESSPLEAQREAYMRQTIRAAKKEGYERIAVVCGAWHVPALADMPSIKADSERLRGLPSTKVAATWVPWTYGRLSFRSGYGAGIESPGWYHHLWEHPKNITVHWFTHVAKLFRDEDLDASPSHIIEAVRLAEALAALRELPTPGLPELLESARSIFCFDSDAPMRLIHEKLLIRDTLGKVPDETPMLPIQQNLTRLQRRLRLKPEPESRLLDLDQRKPLELERSHLLHRLNVLNVPWGRIEPVSGARGTFHEVWRLEWKPEFAVALIEANVWGNTVLAAATEYIKSTSGKAEELPALTHLIERALLAELTDAVEPLVFRLKTAAALTSDMNHLMDALPALANVLRYGNVRQTDTASIGQVVDGLITRICVGLPNACQSLNDDAAQEMFKHLIAVNQAVTLIQNPEHQSLWCETVERLANQRALHGLLAGRSCRLLFEHGVWESDEVARRMRFACSVTNTPSNTAAWIEGFLQGSGLLLLHHESLWQILDNWLTEIPTETFTQVLPLLRRTFSTFPAPERRQMGERVRFGISHLATQGVLTYDFDAEQAKVVLPMVAKLLGLDYSAEIREKTDDN